MTPERFRQVERVFDAVADAPAERRASMLERLCGDDAELRAEVEALLAALAGAPTQIQAAIEREATLVAEVDARRFPVEGWDRYELVCLLGRGGMGTVYRAIDRRLGRDVALKFIHGGDPALTVRLLREARAQARVDHDGVCKVFEVGEVQGKAYIAMRLVRGLPLDEAARSMSLHDKVQVIRDAALALHAAHVLGILHRDVKPSNILVERADDGRLRPVVMDFGIAREETEERGLTETGALMGTPSYMSPEQARGDFRALDRRSDVYSLGATLYELLAGAPPFTGDSAMKIVLAVLNEEPRPLRALVPSTPADLETIAAKCLHKDPGQRYESAKGLADDLDRYIRDEPILGRRESLARRLGRSARRHRALLATAALALAVAGVAGGVTLRTRARAATEAAELSRQAAIERELAQDVKEMEWFLRVAHMLPLHDVTREQAVAKERMKRIEARAAEGGRVAALVDYAVGRGHLALREDREAHERFTRARAGGLDTPELHQALGLALGRLYDRALGEVEQSGDPASRKRRAEDIEARYLRPALASMERGRGARLESPSYLEGLIAYYRRDYEGALRLAEKAREEAPWLHEAVELRAGVHLTRGLVRASRGEFEVADADFTEASRLFDAAAEVGRSDAGLYLGSAEARIQRMRLFTPTSSDAAKSDLDRVLERCEKARAIAPARGEPFMEMARAHGVMTTRAVNRREDPRASATKEIAAAEQALARIGDDYSLHARLSVAHRQLALHAVAHGLEAGASIDAMIAEARRATAATRTHADLDYVRRAGQHDDDHAYLREVQGYALEAKWLVSRGEDPAPHIAPALEILAARLQASPRSTIDLESLSALEALVAEFQIAAGKDARAALARAEESVEKAIAVEDTRSSTQRLVEVRLLRATDALRRGDDPRPTLDALAPVLTKRRAVDPTEPTWALLEARRSVLVAEADAKRGQPTRETLEGARALVVENMPRLLNGYDGGETSEGLAPAVEAYRLLAEVDLRLASASGSAADRGRHRDAGLAACDAGLAINPNHPRLLATRGALMLRGAGAPGAEAARRAGEALRRAVELNPLLRREVAPLIEEASALSGAPRVR